MEKYIKAFLSKNGFNTKNTIKEEDIKIIYDLFHDDIITDNLPATTLCYYGMYYDTKKDHDNTIKYYLLAIDKGNTNAIRKLAKYYGEQKDYDNMTKYYLMAIDKGITVSMFNLALYYDEQKDYDNMMKYYLMAINEGDTDAMFNLAIYYDEQNDYDNMTKYYLMAIDKDDKIAMCLLAQYYRGHKSNDNSDADNNKKAFKYYIMAIDNGNITAKKELENWMCTNDNICDEYIKYTISVDKQKDQKIKELELQNKLLTEENTHYKYMPGGIGYAEAKKEFETISNK